MKPLPPSQQEEKQEQPIDKTDVLFPVIPPNANAEYLHEPELTVQPTEDEYPHESEDDHARVNRVVEAGDFYSSFQFVDNDKKVLCDDCKHCWSMTKRAEVKNLDVNGKAFQAVESYCTAIDHSLFSLNDRFIYECNKFELGGSRRVKRKTK